jgi:hypothetical protein
MDIEPFDICRAQQARPHRGSIDDHGARATEAGTATELGPGQAEVLPQEEEEGFLSPIWTQR